MPKTPVKYGEPGRIRTCDQQLRRLCSKRAVSSGLPTNRRLINPAIWAQVGSTYARSLNLISALTQAPRHG